jgi:hypothetical protein
MCATTWPVRSVEEALPARHGLIPFSRQQTTTSMQPWTLPMVGAWIIWWLAAPASANSL